MQRLALVGLFVSSLMATSVFAAQVETDVDLNNLVSADEIGSTDNAAEVGDFDWDHDHQHHEFFRCFARNRRGRTFEAFGRNPHETQEKALRACYEHGSRNCYSAGCHRD